MLVSDIDSNKLSQKKSHSIFFQLYLFRCVQHPSNKAMHVSSIHCFYVNRLIGRKYSKLNHTGTAEATEELQILSGSTNALEKTKLFEACLFDSKTLHWRFFANLAVPKPLPLSPVCFGNLYNYLHSLLISFLPTRLPSHSNRTISAYAQKDKKQFIWLIITLEFAYDLPLV